MRLSTYGAVIVFALSLTRTAAAQDAAFEWRDHPAIEIGALRLELAGRIETDVHLATTAVGRDSADLSWPAPRAEVRGRVTRRLEFELSGDVGEHAAWKDAFANVRFTRAVEVRSGRFKIPFSREALTGRSNIDFIYRSLGASQLAPGRDAGVMVHGRLVDRRLSYQAGYFAGDGDNAHTAETLGGEGTMALRIVVAPLAAKADSIGRSLQIATALAGTRIDNRLGLRGQTLVDDAVFFDRVYVNGRRRRAGVESFWAVGPVSLATEYMRVADEREAMGFHQDDLGAVRASAWYVAGTWVLTGESKDGRIEPRRPVTRGGPGAIELAARIEALRFSDITHPGTAFDFPAAEALVHNADRVLTVGVNWSLTRHLRVQHNLTIESVADPARSPAPTRGGRFVTGLIRVQMVV
jgi:phosphate-selective porin OprO/OprP